MQITREMTKRQLVEVLANHHYTGDSVSWATKWYATNMTKAQLLEQVEHVRGERTQDQLTYKYDH